ncbi:hypothetical protein HYU22_02460 [Candidatus Woesearchaeota archaeon]|nr:hypothetical protein [Candidatus Woesearchaeota archaeon]
MDTDLYTQLCSYQNLERAFKKARKKRTLKPYVIDFEKDSEANLLQLQNELRFHTYKPQPLQQFVIRDPKVRTINRSAFRDRIVHHALCNIIAPIFEKGFIFDSYANRRGKGTFKAIARFDYFTRKITRNFSRRAYVLKADIRHYFETVDQKILLSFLMRKIADQRICWLIKTILSNYETSTGKGMPLGNLTSQFFANVYLNELDQFVKHSLKAGYYIRYVDDFVIFHHSRPELEQSRAATAHFLEKKLALELHPGKSKIIPLERGTEFLGMKIFLFHKMIKRRNLKNFYRKLEELCRQYDQKEVSYDIIYDFLEGWMAYAKNADTYTLRKKMLLSVEEKFSHEISTTEVNRGRKEQKKKPRQIIAEIKKKKV